VSVSKLEGGSCSDVSLDVGLISRKFRAHHA
jgi:hypothetical protein